MTRTTPAPGCRCICCYEGKPHDPVDEAAIERCLTRAGHAKPRRVTLNVFTMARPKPSHDPATCDRMVCDEPACIAANNHRAAQGAGKSSPFRKMAA